MLMPSIILRTDIYAPIEKVFDLSRIIDFHQTSMSHTSERAIAGRTTGLIELGETVTWRARHFGLYLTLTSRITAMDPPYSFVDEQVKGPFASFSHQHLFEEIDGGTHLQDVFEYRSPLGWLGRLADALFLKQYMERLLRRRNNTLKRHFDPLYDK